MADQQTPQAEQIQRVDEGAYVTFKPHGPAVQYGLVEHKLVIFQKPEAASLCKKIAQLCQPSSLNRPVTFEVLIIESMARNGMW